MSAKEHRRAAGSPSSLATAREGYDADGPAAEDARPANDGAAHLSAREASAGRTLGIMRYVLMMSLIAVVAIFAILLIAYC